MKHPWMLKKRQNVTCIPLSAALPSSPLYSGSFISFVFPSREADIVPFVLGRLPIDKAEQMIKVMTIMAETGCSQAALLIIEHFRHLLPYEDAAFHTAAHALLAGDLEKARMLLEQPLLANMPHADLLRIKVLFCSIAGRLEEARCHWQQLTELQPKQQTGIFACLIGDRSADELILDQGGLADMRMAIKTAYSNRRHAAVNRITDIWSDALAVQNRPNPAIAAAVLVRTLAAFADRHLERLSETSRLQRIDKRMPACPPLRGRILALIEAI